MEAPKCMHCGGRHWSNQPCPAKTKSTKEPPVFTSSDPQRSVVPKRKPGRAGGSPNSPKAGGSRSKPEAKGAGKVIRKSTKPAPKTWAEREAAERFAMAPPPVRVLPKAKTPATPKIAKGLKEAASGKVKVVAKKVQPAPAKRPAHRPRLTPEGFDKKAYQREYMREYRAKLKAKAKKRAKAK